MKDGPEHEWQNFLDLKYIIALFGQWERSLERALLFGRYSPFGSQVLFLTLQVLGEPCYSSCV